MKTGEKRRDSETEGEKWGSVVRGTSYIRAKGMRGDSITLMEGSQNTPARPSGKCRMKLK